MDKKGIFCLEGLWENDLRKKPTVEPVLSLLKKRDDIPYIYGNCATPEEFAFYISKCVQKKYQDYPILYLAFHGEKGSIHISKDRYDLEDVGDRLADKCKGKVIIVGSCNTLNIDKRHLKRFLKKTGAFAVCGYKTTVDWMQSTAFELLLLNILQKNKFDGRGVVSIKSKVKELSNSFKELDFRFVSSHE
jgi:hypothetical protein